MLTLALLADEELTPSHRIAAFWALLYPFATHGELAERAGVHTNTIGLALRAAEVRGWLTRNGKGGIQPGPLAFERRVSLDLRAIAPKLGAGRPAEASIAPEFVASAVLPRTTRSVGIAPRSVEIAPPMGPISTNSGTRSPPSLTTNSIHAAACREALAPCFAGRVPRTVIRDSLAWCAAEAVRAASEAPPGADLDAIEAAAIEDTIEILRGYARAVPRLAGGKHDQSRWLNGLLLATPAKRKCVMDLSEAYGAPPIAPAVTATPTPTPSVPPANAIDFGQVWEAMAGESPWAREQLAARTAAIVREAAEAVRYDPAAEQDAREEANRRQLVRVRELVDAARANGREITPADLDRLRAEDEL